MRRKFTGKSGIVLSQRNGRLVGIQNDVGTPLKSEGFSFQCNWEIQ